MVGMSRRLLLMEISILGVGYVGTVSAGCFTSFGHRVVGVDLIAQKVSMLKSGKSPIVEPEVHRLIEAGSACGRLDATTNVAEAILQTSVTFICVSTPSGFGGKTSLAAVDAVLKTIGDAIRRKQSEHIVVMRSTVPPGTAENHAIPLLEQASGRRHGDGIRYYSNPEFLREGSAIQDFNNPPFTLIGAPPGDDAAVLRELYRPINAPVRVRSYRVAESVKYLSNVYHSVKLAFANEAGAILASNGINAREVFEIFCEDSVL